LVLRSWFPFWLHLLQFLSKYRPPFLHLLDYSHLSNGNPDRHLTVIHDAWSRRNASQPPNIVNRETSKEAMAVTASAIISFEQVADPKRSRNRPTLTRDFATKHCFPKAEAKVVENSTVPRHDRRREEKASLLLERLARCLGLPRNSCYGVHVFCEV